MKKPLFVGLSLLAAAFIGFGQRPDAARDAKPGARINGRPSTAAGRGAIRSAGAVRPLDIDPLELYPPYAPVSMRVEPGVTGLTVYNNTNGLALIDPRRNVISPILLNEFDYATIDPETDQPVGGRLGSEGGGRFDAVLTPQGTMALISNFGDSKIFFIDLSSGMPVVAGVVKIDFFAEDIDIDPTGTWALVSDGGFSTKIAVLHIPTRSWIPAGVDPDSGDPTSYRIIVSPGQDLLDPQDDIPGYANCLAIAADGRTVVIGDYFEGHLNVLLLNPATGELTFQQQEDLWKLPPDEGTTPFLYRPVNVAVSPDGRTVLLANATHAPHDDPVDLTFEFELNEGCNIAVFAIDRPGHVVRQPDVIFPDLSIDGGQSIVFSRDGSRAYYETVHWMDFESYESFQEIQVLSVAGPGQVSVIGSIPAQTSRGTSQLFGVDTMATSPDGRYLYVTNPTVSGGQPVVEVFDLRSGASIKQITTPIRYPDPVRNWPNPPLPPDPNDSGDWIPWLVPVGIAMPEAPIDLGLGLELVQPKPVLGQEFSFKVVLENGNGALPAFGIDIRPDLPAGLEILSASADNGSWDNAARRWEIVELSRGGKATLTVRAVGRTAGGKRVEFGINGQAGYDPYSGNDRAAGIVTVIGLADLTIAVQPAGGTFLINSPFTLQLAAGNLGPLPGVQVGVIQPLPGTWSVQSATPSQGQYAAGFWTIGALGVNASATLQLRLQGSVEGTTALTFPIADTETSDPVPANSQAPITITLVKVAAPLQVALQRLENDLIFSREVINKITWQPNPVNNDVVKYRIRRKTKGAADTGYVVLADVAGSATEYLDRRLTSSDLYTYQVVAVNSRGEESQPVVVGN